MKKWCFRKTKKKTRKNGEHKNKTKQNKNK